MPPSSSSDTSSSSGFERSLPRRSTHDSVRSLESERRRYNTSKEERRRARESRPERKQAEKEARAEKREQREKARAEKALTGGKSKSKTSSRHDSGVRPEGSRSGASASGQPKTKKTGNGKDDRPEQLGPPKKRVSWNTRGNQ